MIAFKTRLYFTISFLQSVVHLVAVYDHHPYIQS